MYKKKKKNFKEAGKTKLPFLFRKRKLILQIHIHYTVPELKSLILELN